MLPQILIKQVEIDFQTENRLDKCAVDNKKLETNKTLSRATKLKDLNLKVDLSLEPQTRKILSPKAFRSYVEGYRPEPGIVFENIARCIDTFVSFENSLADQNTMCELVASWIMGTYFLDAFDVVGYLWPTGERGSGKTQLLNTISSLSFLGRTITSGSSFASIRDEANYGSAIAFDDCENVRQMENNKRELLLAGNMRGTEITFKEPQADGEWKTTTINNFAPRSFSSIGLPDPVLASRTISVPLVTSIDQNKTRRSPSRDKDWPFSKRELIDDLFITAVVHLRDIQKCDQEASEMSELVARNHDIWRMPLAISYWLETQHNVTGVFDRISALSESYQSVNQENTGLDLNALVIIAASNLLRNSRQERLIVSTGDITDQVRQLAMQDERVDDSIDEITTHRVGTLMGRLGFRKNSSHGNTRSWVLSLKSIERIAKARGVNVPDEIANIPF